MTKSSYSTIHEGGETQALTQAGNPETGGSRITTKHRVFFALALTAAFLVGHQTITQGSGLRMNMASTAADLVDLNSDVSKVRVESVGRIRNRSRYSFMFHFRAPPIASPSCL